MKICLATPVPKESTTGNGATARRWASLIGELGHDVFIVQVYDEEDCDLLIALHARKSHFSIAAFKDLHPELPVVLGMAGTDLYGDIIDSRDAQHSLELADRIVTLQEAGVDALPEKVKHKVHCIVQSAQAPREQVEKRDDVFEVCVLAHLRPIKDPLLGAKAARLLPGSSRIRVLLAGQALHSEMEAVVDSEQYENFRFRWLGALDSDEAMALLARCRCLISTSRMEGGANVISEAIACGLPILSSEIPGSIGILGVDHPGYFPVGDALALSSLLQRVERDEGFRMELERRSIGLQELVTPARERRAWKALLVGLGQAQSDSAHD